MTRTWTVVPELPIGATNIHVGVVGEMNAQGQMLQLNGITVTYDEPKEVLLQARELFGVKPEIVETRSFAFDIPLHYHANYMHESGLQISMPCVKTESESIIAWNNLADKIEEEHDEANR